MQLNACVGLKSSKELYKGNSVVLVNRNDYIKRATEMLSAPNKFNKFGVKPWKEINSLLQQQDRLNYFLKKIKRVSAISESSIQEVHSLVSLFIICLKSINHWLAGNKKETFEMLSVTLKESILFFDNKYWSQTGEVAMNSPLGPVAVFKLNS